MAKPELKIAELDEGRMGKLRALEQDLGVVVVAFEPESPFAPLNNEQLQRLRELEQDLGVLLLAYKPGGEARSA